MTCEFDLQRAVRMAGGGSIVDTRQLVGDANETHVADLSDGQRLVIRILRFSTPQRARAEVSVQRALSAAGMVTPISLDLEHGDVVGQVSGLDFTVSRFVEGQHPTTITKPLESDFGRILARFHRATRDLVVDGTGWMNPLELGRTVDPHVRPVDDRGARRIQGGFRRAGA